MLTYGVALVVPLFISIFFIREIDVSEQGETKAFVTKKDAPWVILKDVGTSKSFWKYILLAVLLANVRAVFRHVEATLPKYMLRAFGASAPYGIIYSINPILIIVLTPFVQTFSFKFKALLAVLVGSWISAVSPAWLGISNSVALCAVFVVQLSLGETLWSPRMMGYGTSVAPKGREGTFAAIAAIPLFLSKLPAGLLSGWLLATYCPREGQCDGPKLWLIVFGIAVSSPLFLSLLYKVLYDPLADKPRDEHDAQADQEQREQQDYVLLEEHALETRQDGGAIMLEEDEMDLKKR